jgi:hypothetical protein
MKDEAQPYARSPRFIPQQGEEKTLLNYGDFHFSFFFGGTGVQTQLCACKAGILLLQSCLQPIK